MTRAGRSLRLSHTGRERRLKEETWNRPPTTHSRKAAGCSPTRARTRRSWRSSGARDLEPDKGSIRETLGRAYFRTGQFAGGASGVRTGGRDRPRQRLRPVRPRAVAASRRRPQWRPSSAQARGRDAPRDGRLPRRAVRRRVTPDQRRSSVATSTAWSGAATSPSRAPAPPSPSCATQGSGWGSSPTTPVSPWARLPPSSPPPACPRSSDDVITSAVSAATCWPRAWIRVPACSPVPGRAWSRRSRRPGCNPSTREPGDRGRRRPPSRVRLRRARPCLCCRARRRPFRCHQPRRDLSRSRAA